jgi:hypothetical protein
METFGSSGLLSKLSESSDCAGDAEHEPSSDEPSDDTDDGDGRARGAELREHRLASSRHSRYLAMPHSSSARHLLQVLTVTRSVGRSAEHTTDGEGSHCALCGSGDAALTRWPLNSFVFENWIRFCDAARRATTYNMRICLRRKSPTSGLTRPHPPRDGLRHATCRILDLLLPTVYVQRTRNARGRCRQHWYERVRALLRDACTLTTKGRGYVLAGGTHR